MPTTLGRSSVTALAMACSFGCSSGDTTQLVPGEEPAFSAQTLSPIGITEQALRFSQLPRCSRFLNGLVLYVDAPSEQMGLYACSPESGFFRGTWVRIALEGGEPGASLAVAVEAADPTDCPQGGNVVHTGQDNSGDGVLQPTEVDASALVCNGADGAPGSTGATGAQGVMGPQGSLGLPGASGPAGATGASGQVGATGPQGPAGGGESTGALVLVESVPPGLCPAGGVEISAGIDDDQDGVLEPNEVDTKESLCNGAAGATGSAGEAGPSSLIATAPASVEQCPIGGIVVSVGVDDNGSGVLDPGEVDSVEVVCNGADGEDGADGSGFLQPYTFGHADIALELELEDGEFHPHLHVEGLPQAVVNGHLVVDGTVYDFQQIQIVSSAVFERPDPDSGFFEPLCVEPGQEVHLLPQSLGGTGGADAQNAPFAGIELEAEPGELVGDAVQFSLVSVDGPGEHSMWKDGFPPIFAFSSCDGIDGSDSATVPVGHDHWNIGFSQPGDYTVTYNIAGTLVSDGSLISTDFSIHYLLEEEHE